MVILTQHFQNAYVTSDLDRAVALFVEQLEAPGKPVRMDTTYPITTQEGVDEATLRVAFIQAGRLQYELIQPVSGNVNIYTDAIRPGQLLQFHHVAMRTDSIEEVRAASEKHGRRVVLEGFERGIRFIYIDAREALGHYLEYVHAPDEVWQSMPSFRSSEAGSRPAGTNEPHGAAR